MSGWQQWASAQLGRPVTPRLVDPPGEEARVWGLWADGRAVAYLKQHRVSAKWRRERWILQRLAEPPAAPVPAVLAALPDPPVLLLSALPGEPLGPGPAPLPWRRSLHEQAGRFRRRLDAVEVADADPLPLPEAMAQRHRAWCERARPHLSPALLARVEAAHDPACFEGAARRWCHRDLGPHNWIVQPGPEGPTLHVLDFGQARPDVWLVDMLDLHDGPWREHPPLADAFWAGYGRRPTAPERAQLAQLRLLSGLATATWGERHREATRARHGRAVLERMLQELGA